MKKSSFEKDIKYALAKFPKLKSNREKNHWLVTGDLDICDNVGNYWKTYRISIQVPANYPHCVPIVRELSKEIKREKNRHISDDGICCLDIDHKLLKMAKRGITIADFIKEKIYPFFANQVYFDQMGTYAGKDYRHDFDGIVQFYEEELNIKTPQEAVLIIKNVLKNSIPGRNDLCICGQGKFKECHLAGVEFLKFMDRARLEEDLKGFRLLMNPYK